MAGEILFQNVIFSKFILPFLLVFFIVFAILQKTKILGGVQQTNALVAFVLGLIVVGVAYPKDVIENLILFMVVALVVLFVVLILWGFLVGKEPELTSLPKPVQWIAGIFLVIVVIVVVLWATGFDAGILDSLFYQSWSKTFWSNAVFIVLVGAALALILTKTKSS